MMTEVEVDNEVVLWVIILEGAAARKGRPRPE
jgi:hypothetical protein